MLGLTDQGLLKIISFLMAQNTHILHVSVPHALQSAKHGTASYLLSCDLVNDGSGGIISAGLQLSSSMQSSNSIDYYA